MNDVMTPEDYELLLSLGGTNAQLEAALEQQRAQAEMLRANAAIPQGQMAGGRVYVAPSITQYAAALANAKVAGDKDRAVQEGTGLMLNNRNRQNQMVLQSILRGNQQPGAGVLPMDSNPYNRFRVDGGSA